jgi:predicted metal-binding transcription factor (methanogenesis marker protein 9)
MAGLLAVLLNYPIKIANPFLYMTKAEAIRPVVERHSEMISTTISCWRASRIGGGLRHCGICIPCLVRRISLEANGISTNEYQRDIFSEDISNLPPDDDAKRNLIELAEFIKNLETAPNQAALEFIFPDLANPHFDSTLASQMYLRFAKEAREVFSKYPLVRNIAS